MGKINKTEIENHLFKVETYFVEFSNSHFESIKEILLKSNFDEISFFFLTLRIIMLNS